MPNDDSKRPVPAHAVQGNNPQAEQMGDESMARNLAFQAQAIWPQEAPLFARYALSGALRIVDVGCGTGEITRRLAGLYPQATLLGIDILEENLARARADADDGGGRIAYASGDAFHLALDDGSVDLLVCRHVSQAVPAFGTLLLEFRRVLAPGGRLHLLSEDYGMLHFPSDVRDSDRFWNQVGMPFLAAIGCDGRVGRHTPMLLADAGFEAVTMDYLTVDTLRVPRGTFAGILRSWRDGYVVVLAQSSGLPETELAAEFDTMLEAIETPPAYAVWHVPIVAALAPRKSTRPPLSADGTAAPR
jgi:SAM-dependent methyltransferase